MHYAGNAPDPLGSWLKNPGTPRWAMNNLQRIRSDYELVGNRLPSCPSSLQAKIPTKDHHEGRLGEAERGEIKGVRAMVLGGISSLKPASQEPPRAPQEEILNPDVYKTLNSQPSVSPVVG